MANASNIVINDGQATPVPMTLTPTSKNAKGVYHFEDISEPNPLLRRRATVSVVIPALLGSSSMATVEMRIYDPTPDITAPTTGTGIQPAPSKAYELTGMVTFRLPIRSLRAERKDMRAFLRNLLADSQTQIVDAIENLVAPT